MHICIMCVTKISSHLEGAHVNSVWLRAYRVRLIPTPLPTEMKACSRSFAVLKLVGSGRTHMNTLKVFLDTGFEKS
jgi:hypothetical protein